ncbi:HYR domain-containing protein, partial [Saprospiraceae bacterium]|nr:HYR domain-containing protein [Saprospiraceae bacterium]
FESGWFPTIIQEGDPAEDVCIANCPDGNGFINSFNAKVSAVNFMYSFTWMQTDFNVCAGGPNVVLTNYLMGQGATAQDNFTGDGVNGLGTEFDPDMSNIGTNQITHQFTCEDGSVITHVINIEVHAVPNMDIEDRIVTCDEVSSNVSLLSLITDDSTTGGTFELISGDGVVNGNLLNINTPGCFEIKYFLPDNLDLGNCADVPVGTFEDTAFLYVPANPAPQFTVSSGSGCWDGTSTLSVGIDYADPSYMPDHEWTVVSNGANLITPTITGATTASPTITIAPGDGPGINLTGSIEICLTETVAHDPTGCPSPGFAFDCTKMICRTVSIIEATCSEECQLFPMTTACPIQVNPFFSIGCFGNSINFGDLLAPLYLTPLVAGEFDVNSPNGNGGTLAPLITCDVPEIQVSWDTKLNFPTLPLFNTPIIDLLGLGGFCQVVNFCVPFPDGFCIDCSNDGNDLCIDPPLIDEICVRIGEFCPLGFIGGVICEATIQSVLIDPIQAAVEALSVGLVWADTDGDGAFDYVLQEGSNILDGSAAGTAMVPNNVQGSGTIRVRSLAAGIIPPTSPCQDPTPYNLLDLLPIGAIPIVGDIVETILMAGMCEINIAPSNYTDLDIVVVNNFEPIFLNCPDSIIFTVGTDCETTPNWSAPIAVESCTDQIVDVQKTNGIDPASINPPGIYPIEYTATSCNGLTSTCTFNVVIRPDPPQVQCPAPLIVGTNVDQCSAIVTGITPLQGLGCNTNITWTAPGAVPESGTNDASGSLFPLGETTVNYTLEYTDEFGVIQMSECEFIVTVEDNEKPNAVCKDLEVLLDENGMAIVNVADLNGGSNDNCTAEGDLDIQIAKPGEAFGDSVSFDCFEEGQQTVILRVIDEAMNERRCLALVTVSDYFEGFVVSLDVPELCLPNNNEEQLNFANYTVITEPDGTVISHMDEILDGDMVLGLYGITSFLPSENNPAGGTPGAINALTGEYTPGTGYGFVTISYVLSIDGQVRPNEGLMSLEGCYIIANDVFELRQPLEMGQPECICGDGESRAVDLGDISGGLEPYTIQYDGAWLDVDENGELDANDDTDGEYTYDIANGHTVDDFTENLGVLRVIYTQPVWSITIVDARGCEIFRSGSCDTDDLTEGPEIDCMGANDFDTEVIVCERQYEWMHALPFDNCAVTQYSYTITNPDGTIEGPFDLDALIYSDVNGIPLDELFEAEYEFENGTSVVSYYAEDAVGNFTTCSFTVIVEDNDPPYFINCPYPDVVVSTEFGHCESFVNFALPLAEDNCVLPIVTQIDDTGLSTGDRFPIGTTILTFQAMDGVGNKTLCQVKVTVNNFWNTPTIACPGDVTQSNDDWLCGAVVNNIGAFEEELCSDELIKTYQIVQDGAVVTTGLDDASGTYFEVGESEVTYRVQNQPLLLISEVTQDADALIGGMNPPPIVNEFQCFSDTLFALDNGDVGEGLVYYPVDDLIYHFSGGTDGNEFFEEIYFPGMCVQPNHVNGDTHGPDPAGQITGMVWDPTTEKFIAIDINRNIYTVSTTGDYLQISTFDQAVSLSGFAVDGASVYGVNGTSLYGFDASTGVTATTTVMTSSGDGIVSATDIATDPLSGDTYIIYTTGASATSYIGTLDLATGAITELGDTFIDLAGITIDATGQVYGVSSKAAGSDLYTIKCAIPGDDYIEITNFGPSTYDVSCLNIARTLVNGEEEIYVVPNGIVLAPGEVLVLHYGPGVDNQAGPSYFLNFCEGTDQPAGAILPYSIFFGNNQLDAVDMLADAQGGIIRTGLFDTDSPADFVLAEDCLSITLGEYNPIYPPALDNGTTASLQSEPKSVAECSFKVTVEDVEPPMCMEIDDMNLFVGPALNAVEGECNQSIISVPDGDECILTEINVSLIGDIVGSEFITISLISPQNDTLDLYDQLCVGDAAVDMTFDDESENSASAICGSWNGDFRPQTEMLMEFYTSKLAGDWTLFVNIEAGSGASFNLTSWSIESTCMMDWVMEDVELENDLGLCSAEYTWIHPYYVDNCTFGSISVDYFSDDDIDVPTGGLLVDNFRKGGFEVTEVFGVGTTTVQYTLEDLSGNESQCQFDIVVLDTEDPVITECPGNIFVALEGGECREVVNYVVEAEDNCEVVSIIGVPASGTYFEIGTTEVIVTVTDASGNTSLCVFDVIVVEFEPTSNAFACNNAINLSLDNNCEAVINADMILEGNNYRCYEDYCITITSETGVPHDNFFDVSDINQTFNVSVSDCSGDIQYSCWGTVTIEEKFDPEIGCPMDVTIFCNEDSEAIDSLTGLLLTGEAVIINCEPGAEITYEDNTIDFGQCSNPRMLITRTWIVIDADGNEAQCNQEITIAAVDYASIIFPEDLDLATALECEDVSADESLLTPENTGYPTLNGQNITEAGSLCMISKNVSDEIYDICNGSYEILRTWKLRNMCEPLSVTNPLTHTQIIKVLDTSAPKFAVCPSDTIMSVAPLNCVGNGFLAIPQSINDLCGEVVFDANIYGGGALEISGTVADNNLSVFASNMRKGDHRVEYTAEDDCGNISECSFIVTVVDITPPVVVVKQNVIVNLSTNGDPDSGAAKLFVGSVDLGSFDGCTAVRVEIRRESDNCGISGNTTFNADGHPTDGSPNPNAANYDSDDGQSVMFCCEDIPDGEVEAVVKVIVRVWDDGNDTGFFGDGVDLNGDGDTIDPGEYDNYNESWVDVTVEQKDVPSLACPSDITLACDMDYTDPNLRGTAISSSLCGSVMIDVTYTPQLNACGLGFVIATYSVASTPSVTCSQRITIENPYPTFAENSIKYPRDLPTSPTGQLSCQDDIPFDEPTWTAGPC